MQGPAATVTPYKMGMSRSGVRRTRRKARALVNIVALTKKELRSKNKNSIMMTEKTHFFKC